MNDPGASRNNGYYAADTGNSSDVTPPPPPANPNPNPTTRAKASTSTTTTKSNPSVPSNHHHPAGPRFQCAKCPKNFSRIENLTRHQANHEDIGKFACSVCKKRFTRSDLLNRHRRIHAPSQSEVSSSHVTQLQFGSVSPPSNPFFETTISQGNSKSGTPQSELNMVRADLIPDQLQSRIAPQHNLAGLQQDSYLANINRGGYQVVQLPQIPTSNPSMLPHTQGLTNLMEAALAPPELFDPTRNLVPHAWPESFMGGSNDGNVMGTYDGDMSWVMELNGEALSNYSSDYDMMNTFDIPPQQSLQYPPQQQHARQPPTKFESSENENEEDDNNDWPDNVESQPRRAPRIIPIGLEVSPMSWQPQVDEARGRPTAPFAPKLQKINNDLRLSLLEALNGDPLRNEFSIAEISDAMFPPPEVLDFFLRLYFQFIQPRFPVLHIPTFDIYQSPPLLIVAMILLGSSHSFGDRGRFSGTFYQNLRVACLRMQELDSKYLRSLDNILTYFLLCLGGTWSMTKESYEFAEGSRGVLVTACRRMRLLDCRPSSFDTSKFRDSGLDPQETHWLAWIENEKGKRLGLSVYMYDCQYPALFNNQHFVSKAELTNSALPCEEHLWAANSAESWKSLLGPMDLPKPMYWMRALNCCLLHRYIKPAPPGIESGEFGKILLLYAIHTHIFDWRQATCMLAPTGLLDLKVQWDEGPMREKRIWLIDALNTWADCYQDENTSTAANLLHRLGYISIDINLSDMHLAAGRLQNKNDGSFAEYNLRRWANCDTASSTMGHIYSMLQICHQHVQDNTAADCSYEIAICLFTGGIVCWAFARLKDNGPNEECMLEVRKASKALRHMGAGGCWRSCALFGRILQGFETRRRL